MDGWIPHYTGEVTGIESVKARQSKHIRVLRRSGADVIISRAAATPMSFETP
jgi:hypothetical protein